MTSTDIERRHFQMVNDKVVNEITLDALYKPRTLSVLTVLCVYLIYKAFSRFGHIYLYPLKYFYSETNDVNSNVFVGTMATSSLFLVISAMVFPNGPFIRPHPIFWRIIFGVSVLYALLLQFTVYQTYDNVKKVLTWLG